MLKQILKDTLTFLRFNETLMGKFILGDPPHKMNVYNVTDHTNPNVLATSRCSLYMRGKLPYRVYPPRECQFAFNKCSNSRITYMPYSPSCAVDAQDDKGRKY
uniref:Lipocalin n=1 Tax=Rhipicephalus appendiculatus TaxID=34631 RepID=A0A131Z5Q1_RHIAP